MKSLSTTVVWHKLWLPLLALQLFAAPAAVAQSDKPANSQWRWGGDVGAEFRYFFKDPRWPGQSDDVAGSVFGNLEARWRNEAGNQRASFKAFGRLDSVDNERSHVDLREAYWAYEGNDWEILVGANKVFWGVTESRHLIDIVNQTDLVEDIDQEQKLGQPMVNLMLQRDWGQLEFYVMPWFRERTFPGEDGRLRAPLPVDSDVARYESSAEQHHTDLALRWSHYFGDVDIGVYAFHGTGREPLLELAPEGDHFLPYYGQISQLGVEMQYTRDAWLWKFEGIVRDGLDETFAAAVAGFEYTFYGVKDSSADVGLLLEYLYDGRGPGEPVTVFDSDVFLGTRLALNDAQDSSVLAGVVVDTESREWFFNLEAERRMGQHYVAEARLRIFNGDRQLNQLFAFDRDDYFQLSISRFF
jgi:hypothetical protein